MQVPRPPRKDFYKLMNQDHIVLRFACRLVETPGCTLSESDRSDNSPSAPPGSCDQGLSGKVFPARSQSALRT